MAARTSRKKAPKAAASRRAKPAASPPAVGAGGRMAHPHPVLGNDPFARGAAPRPPAPRAAPSPLAAAAPLSPPPGEQHPASAADERRASAAAQADRRAADAARAAEEARARLEQVEHKVEAALDGAERRLLELADRAGLPQARAELGHALSNLVPQLRSRLGALVELLRVVEPPLRLDRYGMDPRLVERAQPIVEFLYASWWRVQVRDADRVPAAGPALVVANHAGLVPWDALVLRHALRRDHATHRDLRPLLDDRECDLPFVGGAAIRLGAVRATPDAAEAVLRGGDVLGVFPEGSAAARKLWRDRYRIQRFGRGGFVKVALRTGAPIVPCAIVGSEEASPGIARAGWLAELLRLPLLSASPALRFGPAALLPLPSRWTLRFGAPIDTGGLGPAAADDQPAVNALAEHVRATLQGMLDEDVAARGNVFV